MSPQIGQIATRIALFLIIGALFSMAWSEPHSAAFVVSVLVLLIGLAMLALVAIFARLQR